MTTPEKQCDDHVLSPAEVQIFSMETIEAQMYRALEVIKEAGLPGASRLEEQLKDQVVTRKIAQYLMTFTNPEERERAVARMIQEGPPPEVLAPEDAFVVDGSPTIQ